MFDHIFVISQRGDTLVSKVYTPCGTQDACDKFADWLKEARNTPMLPIKELKGCFFFHIKVSTFYLVGTTRDRKSQPFTALELLTRIKGLVKDFCGSLTEEAIVLNRTLILELFDEIADYGFIRTTSTKNLKPYIQQSAVPVKQARQQQTVLGLGPGLFGADFQSAPSTAADKPLNLIKGHQGSVITCEVHGSIQVRSFLSGSPELKIGLSNNLVIGKLSQVGYGAHLRVDKAQFHPAINQDHFNQGKTLVIHPPEGEFTLLKYDISGELSQGLPFQLSSSIEEFGDKQELDIQLKLQCLLPETNSAINITAQIPLPSDTKSLAPTLSSKNHNIDFIPDEKKVVWTIKKMLGRTESVTRMRVHLNSLTSSSKLQVGPINLEFEIKDWTSSQLQIRFLKVFDPQRSYVPQRWVRYVTHSNSYMFRLR
ncbi:AP-4 complex subunit mu-1 [Holothuria leucospilota]|uniref:AP-4 complex subunit mu-1 n=1 Tax=Holothuria leucospilota TaxID=206669 RepID=A0A9Q1HGT8_HOLLE|nr:AP-4 complex subunit mu-1 [Holothuria leucospilota]